jgi:queuine tRNA-ribosyltransferase
VKFQITKKDSTTAARTGIINTAHGDIVTPVFMPVGTLGAVKAVHFRELEGDIGAEIILGNTYHLYLRPGVDVVREAGGLHRFNSWNRPILTDSGGYQVYSLSNRRKITEEGAEFRSHIDGSAHFFTPENVMDIQREIGADIIMAFDECTPYPCDYDYAERSMEMTHRWLDRCCARFDSTEGSHGYEQALLPIVQGSVYPDLRARSAEYIAGKGREANAIGGLSVGEPHEDMYAMTELVCGILPADKPRYLMGVGTPENILECIGLGVDMFDCVMPTRNARHGLLFTSEGIINIRNRKWQSDFSAIDAQIDNGVSNRHNKAFLRHLLMTSELLAYQIASVHNLSFYIWLVKEARQRIADGSFGPWKDSMVKRVSQRL